jgi:hypothetical protein
MAYEILYFNDVKEIIQKNNLEQMIDDTCRWIEEELPGTRHSDVTLKCILEDCGWRENPESLRIINGRRYRFKGYLKKAAVEANLGYYEFLWEGLFRLQVGYDKGAVEMGILMLNGRRSDKSPLGNSLDLVVEEIDELYPTISLPVAVILFDLEVPVDLDEEKQSEKVSVREEAA